MFKFKFLFFIIISGSTIAQTTSEPIFFIGPMIHYNIGRFTNKETKLELPTKKDFIKIVFVMCVFALIQGLLTSYFTKLK